MKATTILVTLAAIPGQYIAEAKKDFSPAIAPGERCEGVLTIPAPWNIGKVCIVFDWFVPSRRGSLPFWRAIGVRPVHDEEDTISAG